MIRRRIGRPGLVGTMARTAVIAGTATAVSGGIQRNQQARAAEQQQQAEQQYRADVAAQQTQPVAPAPPDTVAQLAQLGELKQAGLIDDAEFAAAKARLLGL